MDPVLQTRQFFSLPSAEKHVQRAALSMVLKSDAPSRPTAISSQSAAVTASSQRCCCGSDVHIVKPRGPAQQLFPVCSTQPCLIKVRGADLCKGPAAQPMLTVAYVTLFFFRMAKHSQLQISSAICILH